MDLKQIKYELQNLISGKSSLSYDALIQTVTSHLRIRQRIGPTAEEKHKNKRYLLLQKKKMLEFFNKLLKRKKLDYPALMDREALIIDVRTTQEFLESSPARKTYAPFLKY